MRIDKEKGWDRMIQMAQMMKNANIDFVWDIYTNNPQKTDIKEFIFTLKHLKFEMN